MSHLDNEQLAELKDVLEDEFSVLVTTYLQDADLRMQQIREAFAKSDNEACRLASHSLKGASANLGATQLSAYCERLEHACRAGQVADCGALVSQVSHELLAVRRELEDLI